MFWLDAPALAALLQDFGHSLSAAEVVGLLSQNQGYTEPLFQLLGAREIRSFDASAYEGASDLHDFNLPIPERWCGRFSAMIDGGCLEHVFNFPVAIKNCMQMLQVGGHFLAMSPANNWFGHGFYQFSPELFFRVFSRGNGFEMVATLVCELDGKEWFEVADAELIKSRVSLINTRATFVMTLAKKVAEVPIFSTPPQQSDFVRAWTVAASQTQYPPARAVVRERLASRLRSAIPRSLKAPFRVARGLCFRNRPLFDGRFFKRVTIP